MALGTRVLVTEATFPPGAEKSLAIRGRARVYKLSADFILFDSLLVVTAKLQHLIFKLECENSLFDFIIVHLALHCIFRSYDITPQHMNMRCIFTNLGNILSTLKYMFGTCLCRWHQCSLNLKEDIFTVSLVWTLDKLIGAILYKRVSAPHLSTIHTRRFRFGEKVPFDTFSAGPVVTMWTFGLSPNQLRKRLGTHGARHFLLMG